MYMIFSVLIWSLFPLVSVWGIEQLSIFDYILWTYTVSFIATALGYCLVPRRVKENLPKLDRINRRIFAEIVIAALCAILTFACLLKYFSYISRASAVVVAEVWSIIVIYVAPMLVKKGWEKISRRDLLFSLLALGGVALVLVPEARNPAFTHPLYYVLLPVLGGVFMAVRSAIKPHVALDLEDKNYPIASLLKTQMLFTGATVLLCIPFALLWPDKHSVYTAGNISIILFTGIAIHTLANMLYTFAMLRSAKSKVLVFWCLKPVFAVLWLWLAGEAVITDHTILGALFIVTPITMMTIKADRSMSYAATMVGILLCGVYVYFVDGLNMDDYYQAISVPLFFYAILVAFMMDRLIKSDELEEQLAIGILNHIDEHAAKMGAVAAACRKHILGMVTTNDVARVNTHYRAVRNNPDKHLGGIYSQLDQLVLSKVRGTTFAEMFIIFIVGILTVVTSIVYRPNDFIAAGFAIILSLSTIFIFFTILDLSENRRLFYLERDKNGETTLSQQVTADLLGERVIASVLIMAILAAFTGLLLVKYAAAHH